MVLQSLAVQNQACLPLKTVASRASNHQSHEVGAYLFTERKVIQFARCALGPPQVDGVEGANERELNVIRDYARPIITQDYT